MKLALLLLLCLPPLTACTHLRESDEVDPRVLGAWGGEGRFLDRDLHEEYGTFPIALEIRADRSVAGTVGQAGVVDGVIVGRPEDFVVDARLGGPVFTEGTLPGLEKDCVVFLLQPQGADEMGGNVHLKTNQTFDLGMRVCGLELKRAP